MIKRIALAGVAAGIGVAMVSGVTAQATSPTAAGTVSHLILIDHNNEGQTRFIDNAPKGTDSLGDSQVFNEATYQNGKKIGRSYGQATAVRVIKKNGQIVGEAFQFVGTAALPGGQLTFQGVVSFSFTTATPPYSFAITGGTGKYQTARGQITVQNISDTRTRIDVALITG